MSVSFVPYHPGTLTATNGSKNVTGSGTNFTAYDLYDELWIDGYPCLIATVTDDTHVVLDFNFLGTTGSGKAYDWKPTPDVSRAMALDTLIANSIQIGNLASLAGLTLSANNGLYATGAGTLALFSLTAAGRALVDDASANAQLGTLGLATTSTDNAVARFDSTAGHTQNSGVIIDDSNNVSGIATLTATNASLGNTGLKLADTDASALLTIAVGSNLTANRTLTVTTGDANRTLTLNGSATLDQDVSTTSTNVAFNGGYDAGGATNGKSLGNIIQSSRTGTTTASHAQFANGNGVVGQITTNASATSFVTSSDYRLKCDVAPLVEPFTLDTAAMALLGDPLKLLMALRPISHHWNADPQGDATHGFLAHEVQALIPQAVVGAKDATETVGTAVLPAIADVAEIEPQPATEDHPAIPGRAAIAGRPERRMEGIAAADAPEGWDWTATGQKPVYQAIDTSFMMADVVAALQELTLLVVGQQAAITALEAD